MNLGTGPTDEAGLRGALAGTSVFEPTDRDSTPQDESGCSGSDSSSSRTSRYLYRDAITDAPLRKVLEQVAPRIEGAQCAWYRFDGSSFRKMVFMRLHEPFLEAIRPHYFPAKWRKYGDKEITYNSFTTLLRQICNATGRSFYTKHVYDHSVCNTVYFVTAPEERLFSVV